MAARSPFAAISVAELAAEAGVSPAKIYQRFSNRDATASVLLELYYQRVEEWARRHRRDDPDSRYQSACAYRQRSRARREDLVSRRPFGATARVVWEELRADANVPRAFRYVLKAARTRTSTCASAPLDRSARLSSVVVYNHGLISFASENTTLMEHLASCGHVVLALRHVEQMAELQALNRRDSASKRKADAEAARQLRMSPPEERARLAVEYYRQSVNTNLIVGERARDTSFVLDRLQEALQRVPGVDEADVDCDAIHAVGFSVGGAVATETAHRDGRVKSVTNLDGGFYGTEPPAPIRQPYLMMYSAANEGINDLLLPEHTVRRTPPSTAHLNYHDVSVLLPFLRYTGVTGKVNPRELIVLRNSAAEAFIRAVDETSVSSANALSAP